MLCINSDSDCAGRIPNSMWMWSGIPLIMIGLWLLPLMIPIIYLYNSSCQELLIIDVLFWTTMIA